MAHNVSIKGLMTKGVVSIGPDTSIVEAVDMILKHNFNGLPVVDKEGVLVGILTEYDLTVKGSAIHLPTFIKLLQEFKIYKKDKDLIRDDIKKILDMKVKEVMNSDPLSLNQNAPLEEALRAFGEHHKVNPIPIVDDNKKLVGILSRYDAIKLLGAPSVSFNGQEVERELDQNINNFLRDFESKFILVSGYRTHYWLITSILFAVVGFIIAFAIIVRIK